MSVKFEQSVLVEIINEIQDKRPLVKELLCEAILMEIEDKMERAYKEGVKDGIRQMADRTWTKVRKAG